MHSFTAPSGRTYLHNGDFSGDVTVALPLDVVRGDSLIASIPMADLVALVAEKIRRERISELENMTASAILLQGRD